MSGAASARLAGAWAFAAQGLCFAALVTRIPTIQERFDLGEGELAILLGLVPIVAGIGSVVAGAIVTRIGAAASVRIFGPLTPLALVLVGTSSTLPLLLASLVVIGFALGAVDASMNAHAVAVERVYRRSIMGAFFAVFSLAGIVGAALAALAAGSDLPLGAFFAVVAVLIVPVQLVLGPRLLTGRVKESGDIEEVPTGHSGQGTGIDWRPVLVVGVALMCVYIADSAASNWSAVYLTDGLGSTESVAALAYACYAAATLVARTGVDRGVMARGPVLLVRVGGLAAAVAAGLIALAPSPAWGLVFFALLGLGAAPVIPLAFSAAAGHDPQGTGLAVARVNVFNYVGFVVGAPLIGVVAELTSLRWAFAALVPVMLVVVALAPAFARTLLAGRQWPGDA